MIISRGRRYIFVHIPKTGGTALSLALEARAMRDDILIGDTPKARRRRGRLNGIAAAGRVWKHSTLCDVEGLVTRQEMEDFLVFTLIRNPWDRMVSYYHWLRGQRFDHPAVRLAAALPFGEFVLHPHTQASFAAAPFTSYLRLPGGAEAKGLYLRLERLEEDLPPLEAHLGFHLPPLARVNVSVRDRDYRRYYTETTAEAVGRFCASDISRFGYRFDGNESSTGDHSCG